MKKLKLYEISSLSDIEQINAVWSFGVHMDAHIKDNIAINLYSFSDFYCEV